MSFRRLFNRLAGHATPRAAYVPTPRAELQNAVAAACIASVHRYGVPRTLAAWNNRQIAIADALADSAPAVAVLAHRYDVLALVARTFPKVCPRVYDATPAERLARASGRGASGKRTGARAAVAARLENGRTSPAVA